MKQLAQTLIAFCAISFMSVAHAGSDAGKDSARHYKSYPEKYNDQTVGIDCTFVKRINGGPQVEGVAFFVAHTIDDDNQMRGGAIVIAVREENADALAKKFGNVPDIDRDNRPKNTTQERVDSKRLSGTFHQLAKGHVYIDVNGDAHELIMQRVEDSKSKIRMGDGIPSTGGDAPGHPKGKKKKKF